MFSSLYDVFFAITIFADMPHFYRCRHVADVIFRHIYAMSRMAADAATMFSRCYADTAIIDFSPFRYVTLFFFFATTPLVACHDASLYDATILIRH